MEPTVIPISLGFVSVFLLRGNKDILVDAGIAGAGGKILADLRTRGIDPRKLSLILITHGHGDHYGGVRELVGDISCPVAIHDADKEALRTGGAPIGTPIGLAARIMVRMRSRRIPPALPLLEPGIILRGPFDLNPFGVDGVVEPTPGHTPGSVSLFLSNGEAIVGDLLRGPLLGRGSPRWPFMADDLGEARRSIARVLDRQPRRIWTSHGGPFTGDEVRAFLRRNAG
jgi:hydroxyacylglutathione hydrolase